MTEVGFSCPAGAVTYWAGRAQGDKEYKDLAKTPEAIANTTAMLAANTARTPPQRIELSRHQKVGAFPPIRLRTALGGELKRVRCIRGAAADNGRHYLSAAGLEGRQCAADFRKLRIAFRRISRLKPIVPR
jgi:hypothetical protein